MLAPERSFDTGFCGEPSDSDFPFVSQARGSSEKTASPKFSSWLTPRRIPLYRNSPFACSYLCLTWGANSFQRLTALLPSANLVGITRLWGLLWVLPFNLLRNRGLWRVILLRFGRLRWLLLDDGFEGGALGLHTDVAVVLQHLL